MATDPVCGMWVEERPSSLHLNRDNRTYYFCSETCLRQFSEPETAQRRLGRRLLVAWPLALAVVVLTYFVRAPSAPLAAAALASIVQFYPGATFYRGTLDAIRDRSWNMDILIAVGTTTAYAYSVAAIASAGRLPSPYFFDASSLIIALILTGNYLEHLTRSRAGSAVRRLQELLPETASVVRGESMSTVPVAELTFGDRIRVLPGGRFPADGIIRSGRTHVDESLVTGESMPVPRAVGDRVLAASRNVDGAVDFEATGVGSSTFLATVGQLLTDAEMSRVPLKRTADRISSIFVPLVVALGALSAAAWYALGGADFPTALLVFVTVVIIACPCAFGIATPAAILVGTGRAAEAGILFRGEDTVEQGARVRAVVFDKTGTLTTGRPTLRLVQPSSGVTEEDLLLAAASIEAGADHPLARAVVDEARARGLRTTPANETQLLPGVGMRGSWQGRTIEVVRPAEPSPGTDREGGTSLTLAEVRVDGRTIGMLGFGDELGAGVPEALRALRAEGIRIVLATGDRLAAARPVADSLGITEVHAALTPAEKVELVRSFPPDETVAFVGDGLNDAPALAAAPVGIALGTGPEVARSAGGILLVRSDLRAVPLALEIARRTVAKVRANLAWAIGYNLVLLPIAVGVLVPWWGLGIYRALPVVGAIAMGLSSTAVVLNSLSLRWVRLPHESAPGLAPLPGGTGL
ncbi:MAG TPA: heavy metal translocating P-type ATPase [Thermoplasmata archaeon]|nr:heavy metal translocating P-type ATPase [Thermoplasmata archaeon]